MKECTFKEPYRTRNNWNLPEYARNETCFARAHHSTDGNP